MQEVGLEVVLERIAKAFVEQKLDTAEAYLWPALDQFPNVAALWFFAGNIWHQRGMLEPSVLAFQKCLDLDYNPNVLTNLGASYRRLNRYDDGIRTLEQAIRDMPDSVDALVNLGGMYVNEGNPYPGMAHLERARKIEGKGKSRAEWNLALLKLESGDFKEGFELYRRGIHAERPCRKYSQDEAAEPALLTPEIVEKVRHV